MATTYLNKTLGTPTNNKIWTWSAWVKRANLGSYGVLFNASNSRDCIRFRGNNDRIQIFFSEVSAGDLETNAVYRDTNAFYHLVLAVDTTQATASNRVKFYVNGEQVTSWATETYPAQNYACKINSAIEHRIGKDFLYTEYFEGIMSHVHFCDGTQLAPTVFGETDATTGEWKIKTAPDSYTLGTNGFTILKDGSTITDQSSNSNDWSLAGGTLTDVKDNPSNVFAVGNRLIPSLTTYTNGNLTISNGASWKASGSTLAVTQGKYYAEMKVDSLGGVGTTLGVEDMDLVSTWSAVLVGTSVNGRGYYYNGNVYNNGSASSYGASYTTGDIISIALDMDNKFVYFRKNNGAWENSGNPVSGSTGTGGLSLAGTTYCFAYAVYSSTVSLNFGNGYFGTTAITTNSGNGYSGTDGKSKFSYQPPTGYSALSTVGLNL